MFLFPVNDLKLTVFHTDTDDLFTDLKKFQEKFTEQFKICSKFIFLNLPVGYKHGLGIFFS